MSDMQIAVWFRRETGIYVFMFTARQIFINNLADKISSAVFHIFNIIIHYNLSN